MPLHRNMIFILTQIPDGFFVNGQPPSFAAIMLCDLPIFHEPVIIAILLSVPHHQYSMVDMLVAACGIIVDPLFIVHEALMCCVYGNGNRPNCGHGNLQCCLVSGWQVHVTIARAPNCAVVVMTGTFLEIYASLANIFACLLIFVQRST